MNRLSPWIARRTRNEAAFTFPQGVAQLDLEQAAGWLQEARLFAAGWVAGLVFFGTLFA
jgi:hypothetical protein